MIKMLINKQELMKDLKRKMINILKKLGNVEHKFKNKNNSNSRKNKRYFLIQYIVKIKVERLRNEYCKKECS